MKDRTGFIVEKNGKTYARICYTDNSGKRRELMRLAPGGKREAKKLLKQLNDEIFSKANPDQLIEGSRLTFGKLADIYQERKLTAPQYVGERKVAGLRSWKVLRGYLLPLREHFGRQKIVNITSHELERYKLARLATPKQRGGKARTITSVNRELELLRSIFVYAKRAGWLEINPFERGERLISKADETRRERVLSLDEEKRLLEASENNDRRSHIKPLLICALDTGMRRGEILSMRWPEVDLLSRTITIKALNTKTLTARTVPISERLAREFVAMRQNKSDADNDALIFSVSDIRKAFKAACKDAGIGGLHFHDLRATTASRLISAGMGLEATAKLLGHTVLGTTYATYLRIGSQTIGKAADLLNQLNAWANPANEFGEMDTEARSILIN